MTETTEKPAAPNASDGGSGKGLSTMLLPELKKVAGGLGIKAAGMKKADLVAAIKAAQGGGRPQQERAPRRAAGARLRLRNGVRAPGAKQSDTTLHAGTDPVRRQLALESAEAACRLD